VGNYGGVPHAIVPDNFKSAVTKASRYEAILNTEFERFGEYYGVTAYPTCACSPKDKAHVENAVKLTYKDIFTVIELLHCPDLCLLNIIAIRVALEKHNNKNLDRRNYSRRSYFEDVERRLWGT
jgi:transposase